MRETRETLLSELAEVGVVRFTASAVGLLTHDQWATQTGVASPLRRTRGRRVSGLGSRD